MYSYWHKLSLPQDYRPLLSFFVSQSEHLPVFTLATSCIIPIGFVSNSSLCHYLLMTSQVGIISLTCSFTTFFTSTQVHNNMTHRDLDFCVQITISICSECFFFAIHWSILFVRNFVDICWRTSFAKYNHHVIPVVIKHFEMQSSSLCSGNVYKS